MYRVEEVGEALRAARQRAAMVAPEDLRGLVDRALERLGLETVDVEALVDGDPSPGDLEGAGLVLGEEEDRVAVTEGAAGGGRGSQRPRLARARRGPHESREEPTEVGAVSDGQDPEERLPLGGAEGRERRREGGGRLVALERPGREALEGGREASALQAGGGFC